jgi:hypothetical protein
LDKEKEWKVKSRALWIDVGDQNTKYFQNFARSKSNNNSVWKLTNRDSNKVRGFHDLANLRVHHFKEIFKEPNREKVASYFPIFVNEEENNILYKPMTKEKLMSILRIFQKDCFKEHFIRKALKEHRTLTHSITWGIWLVRMSKFPLSNFHYNPVHCFFSYKSSIKPKSSHVIGDVIVNKDYAWSFLMEPARVQNTYTLDSVLFIVEDHYFTGKANLGIETNNQGEFRELFFPLKCTLGPRGVRSDGNGSALSSHFICEVVSSNLNLPCVSHVGQSGYPWRL